MYSTPLILSSTMGESLEGCGSDKGGGGGPKVRRLSRGRRGPSIPRLGGGSVALGVWLAGVSTCEILVP